MIVERMMVFMAHPDDVEISCYGLIKKMVNKGTACYIVIVTSGEKGVDLSKNKAASIRKEETNEALSGMVEKIIWLEMDDGYVKFDSTLISNIQEVMMRYSPQLIITHYPDDLGIEHQDHNVVGRATINAAFRYANNLQYLLLAEPLFSSFTRFNPNCFVDISNIYDEKNRAIKSHKSQKNKFYMSDDFQKNRATAIAPYINFQRVNQEQKYEMFQILYEKIL